MKKTTGDHGVFCGFCNAFHPMACDGHDAAAVRAEMFGAGWTWDRNKWICGTCKAEGDTPEKKQAAMRRIIRASQG